MCGCFTPTTRSLCSRPLTRTQTPSSTRVCWTTTPLPHPSLHPPPKHQVRDAETQTRRHPETPREPFSRVRTREQESERLPGVSCRVVSRQRALECVLECPKPMRHGHSHAGHSTSATWLADLSPITNRSSPPPPPPGPFSRDSYQSTWHTTPRTHHGSDAGSLREPPRWNFTATTRMDGLSSHLVRSRSPPSRAASPCTSGQPRAARTVQAPRPAPSDVASSGVEPSVPANMSAGVRTQWAFTPHPSDSPVVQGAVAAGQQAAAVHRASAAFFDAFADLAREAAGRVVEVNRHRLAAQYSTEKCRAAEEAHTRACIELRDAQVRLKRLETTQEQRTAAAAKRVEEASFPPADAPVDVMAAQLDAEMTELRTLKERFSTLCTRKIQLEAQVEELEEAGRDLASRLDTARQQRARQLQQSMATSSHPSAATQPPSEVLAGALEDLSVCLMERRGLLRHLRDGARDRLQQFRVLVAATQGHSHATASASTPCPPPSVLLDDMAQVHTALCEGEEEALNEMEQLLLQLKCRDVSSNAKEERARSPNGLTAGKHPMLLTPNRVDTEENT